MLFERPDDDLKYALDILALADRPGDLLQQVQPRQLGLHLRLRELALRRVPGDLGRADDPAPAVPDRGNGDGNVDSPSVFSHPYRLEMIDRFTSRHSSQDAWL